MQQADVNTTQMQDVVQSCDHNSPDSNDQSSHSVDEEEQVGQKEEAVSGNQCEKKSEKNHLPEFSHK